MTTISLAKGEGQSATNARVKLTKNEELILGVIETANKPLKAYDILEAVMENGIRSPMTIYRALKGLASKGKIHKITHLNAFVLADEKPRKDTVRATITCETCEKTTLVSIPQDMISSLFGATGMVTSDFVIEARGTCDRTDCPR
ncbi:MAG: hypothetical protein AAFX02_01175 [Pseudomonadota bacterium]